MSCRCGRRNNDTENAPLAQLVEHLTLNQGVQGSSPWRRTQSTVFDEMTSGTVFFCAHSSERHRKIHVHHANLFAVVYMDFSENGRNAHSASDKAARANSSMRRQTAQLAGLRPDARIS